MNKWTHMITTLRDNSSGDLYLIRIILIAVFFLILTLIPTYHSFSKLITIFNYLFFPALFECIYLILKYMSLKKANNRMLNVLAVLSRIMILAVTVTALYSFEYSRNETNFQKAQTIYSTVTSEALAGIAEDSNTHYTEDDFTKYSERPKVTKSNYSCLFGKMFEFGKDTDFELSIGDSETSTLETEILYLDHIPNILKRLSLKMSVKDVERNYSEIDSSCWREYTTEDGYTCLTYYQNREHNYQNMYSLIIVGNGKLLTLDLNAFLFERAFDFDEMGIEDYYIDFLRENQSLS